MLLRRLLLRCTVVCCCVALSAFACRYASCTSAQICVRSASAFSTRTLTYLPCRAVPPIADRLGLDNFTTGAMSVPLPTASCGGAGLTCLFV